MIKKTKNKVDAEKQENLIKVVALAKYYESDKPGLFVVVEFKDVDNSIRRLMIPSSIVNQPIKLKTLLLENCFTYSLPNNAWKDIQKILSKEPDGRMQLVEKPGFHNGVFLQANNNVIGDIKEEGYIPILDPASRVQFPSVELKEKLKDWKTNIAESALHSSRIMLSIASAFSPYLLWITGIESGGFHFYGTSSTGKSTCQNIAQSVQGSQEGIESWSLTEAGAEELAAGHNDQLLVLDELGNLDSDPAKAAQKAAKIIYTLSFGKDKRRTVNYVGERLSWRIVFLSSGERSLSEHAIEGGSNRMLGEEVRLIDVPADAGKDLGIFERLPKDTSPAQYAEKLKSNCKEYYGTAQQIFLMNLTDKNLDDSKALKDKIYSAMQEFMDKHQIDGSKGYESRIAKRFALAYAAGKLAVEYRVLPFGGKSVMDGISKCYVDTINSRPKSEGELVNIGYEAIANELKKTGNFLDIRSKGHSHSIEQLDDAFGYISTFKGQEIRVITSKALKSLIPNDKIMKKVLEVYVNESRLACDADGKRTLQVKSNLTPPHKLSRAYCFLSKRNINRTENDDN